MSALVLGLVAAFCWGVHDVTIRKISQTAPLMATLLGVLVVGACFQAIVMAATAGFTALPGTAILYSVAAGVTFLLASIALYNAFHRGPVRVVAPIIGSYPILSVALAAYQGEPVTGLQWLAVIAVVVGIALVAVFADAEAQADLPPVGTTILISALAAFGFFATFAFGHAAARMADDLPSILLTRLTSIALLLPLFPLLSLPFLPDRAALPFIGIMGMLDGVALLCVMSAGSLPGSQYAVVAASTFGLVTVVLASVFLRERLTARQWGGCVIAFAGIGYLSI